MSMQGGSFASAMDEPKTADRLETFLDHNFDKLLLMFVFVVIGFFLLWFATHHLDDTNQMAVLIITGFMSMISGVVGAIVALTTGGLMARRNNLDKPDAPQQKATDAAEVKK